MVLLNQQLELNDMDDDDDDDRLPIELMRMNLANKMEMVVRFRLSRLETIDLWPFRNLEEWVSEKALVYWLDSNLRPKLKHWNFASYNVIWNVMNKIDITNCWLALLLLLFHCWIDGKNRHNLELMNNELNNISQTLYIP